MPRTLRFYPTPWRVRIWRWARSVGALLLLAGMAWLVWVWNDVTDPSATPYAPTAQARPRAVDGDSFVVGARQGGNSAPTVERIDPNERVRLDGIDAPELAQLCQRADGGDWACGAHAHAALADLLATPGLTCTLGARDAYGRRIARCQLPGTGDLGALLVRRGFAVATGRADDPRYGFEEEQARVARAGIWQGRFQRPADWRSANPRH